MSDAWLQLTLVADRHSPEQLEDALLAAGALAVTLSCGDGPPVLEPAPGENPVWERTRVTGLFEAQTDIAAVRFRLERQLGPEVLDEARLDDLAERDWTRAWLDDFHPMRFGRRLWVCPGDAAPPDPEAVNLLLDPGLAFGTGTHPTTALCLEWLDGAELAGRRVIDYGCGSGILAIAAALLGAERVRATDIDPQALIACDSNAARNRVAERIDLGPPEALGEEPADLLLANILAGPLIALAPRFAGLLRPGGSLVLSGILAEQGDEVRAAYAPWFDFEPPVRREEWLRLSAVRKG
jgi:ribosomal protein L11 methyltransferase